MDNISKQFARVKQNKKIAFMPFVVAGYPNFKISLVIARALAKKSDFLEIGFPYSDPLADGPAIQRANTIALQNGMTIKKAFEFVKEIKKTVKTPITILVYANIVYSYGLASFYSTARKMGADAVLVPDVPMEEIGLFALAAKQAGIVPICMVGQTTDTKRLKKIVKVAGGYLYVVSILGTTGTVKKFNKQTITMIKTIKSQTNLPLAVGFGISNNNQIRALFKAGANGVIVGSAFAEIIDQNLNNKNLAQKLIKHRESLRV